MTRVDRVILGFSSAGGLGYLPKAPGTFGTLAALPLWWATADWPLVERIVFTLVAIVFSIWVSDRADAIYGQHDSGKIVIDEVVGLLTAVVGIPFDWPEVILAFALFRVFDIAKPPPIRQLDQHVSGGLGVVLDDVVAGLFACAILHGLRLGQIL